MAELQQQIAAGMAGQALPTGAQPVKSSVAADVAGAAVASQKKEMLAQAQDVMQKQKRQSQSIALASQLSQEEAKQRETSMLQQVNRQINDIHNKLSQQRLDIASDENIAQIEQLSFLNNLSNRRWADEVKREGARRRLDNEVQMKEALLYANFDDMMSLLNSDLDFKKAMNADERTFQEYIARISPEAAIRAAIQMQKDEMAAKSVYGAVKGVSEATQQIAQSGYFSEKKKPGVDIETAEAGGAGSGVLSPEFITNSEGVSSVFPGYRR